MSHSVIATDSNNRNSGIDAPYFESLLLFFAVCCFPIAFLLFLFLFAFQDTDS